jgi:hypothetical protein
MPRRTIGAFVAVASLAVPAIAGASPSATAKTTHFRSTLIGAQVSPTENVYDVRGPVRGASIQLVKDDSAGTGGTDTATIYYGTGTVVTADKFSNSTPDASGIVTISGSGRFVRGTGLYKHVSGKYTFSGTLNTKNGRLKVLVVGTQTL